MAAELHATLWRGSDYFSNLAYTFRMSQLTLHLPDNVAADLAEAGRESNRTPEQVAEDMLKRMIALRQFKRLGQNIRQALGPDAPRSEEEIFEQIS